MRTLLFALLSATSLASCQTARPPVSYECSPCPLPVPKGARVDCGVLSVPENYDRPAGRTVRLPVAIYRAPAPAPDPILWLVGGPGGRAHALSHSLYERVVAPYNRRRDFIVIEIRGTGFAQPKLDCPNMEANERGLRSCRDHLASKADLSQYHSANVARDISELRQALGYREWNLFGESYGTRLALTAMRDQPEGIRSVVLDSVAAPEVDALASGPSWLAASLDGLARNCAADQACKRAYPDLTNDLRIAAGVLDSAPVAISGSLHGSAYSVRLDGTRLMSALRMALYESDLIPLIPRAIRAARNRRDDEVLRRAVGLQSVIRDHLVDVGAAFSFACRETVPFHDRGRLRAEDERHAWLRHAGTEFTLPAVCEVWNVPAASEVERERVKSAIPTLLLSGEYDPATPASNATSASQGLSRSYRFMFPGLGHWVTVNNVNDCPQRMVLQFLEHPERAPDAACIEQMRTRWAVE